MLGIVMVVISLALPALARARLTSTELACKLRVRELGGLLAAYAVEHDDLFPSSLGDGEAIRNDPNRWAGYTYQVFSTFPREPWLSWSGLDRLSEILYCPANQEWPDYPPEMCDPDFVLSASVLAEARYLDPELPQEVWRARLGAKIQRHSATVFPDRKVAILEHRVWHGWGGSSCEGCSVDNLFYFDSPRPGSLWFTDGHVAQVRARDAMPYVQRGPIWPVMPFGTTAWGLQGRDIP